MREGKPAKGGADETVASNLSTISCIISRRRAIWASVIIEKSVFSRGLRPRVSSRGSDLAKTSDAALET